MSSKKVDNRVVKMTFDNKQFEAGVKESQKSITNLKKGLEFKEEVRSLDALSAAGKRFSLAGIENSLEKITSKFSAMSIMGITALTSLANHIINTTENLTAALTTVPIGGGYNDYIEKLTSIQTVSNSSGKALEVVGAYFDQLDTYADKTIYNVRDMTSSFAKFTNAGVTLERSVPSIKGIANMTALAGQNAAAAQIAMYNLSQSIAGGFLTTTDFKSLNLANVATIEWKQHLVDAAVAAKTLVKTSDGLYGIVGTNKTDTLAALFSEDLSTGWANSDILLKVLSDYGDETTAIGKKALAAAQDVKDFGMMMETLGAAVGTGWTGTFEILIGDLNEAKALFTPITKVVGDFLGKISDARNQTLQVWKDNGGRTALIEGLAAALKTLFSILKPIGDAFKQVFPPVTGQRLAEITKNFRDMMVKFQVGSKTIENIKKTFVGLFSILKIGFQFGKLIIGIVGKIFGLLAPAGTGIILSFTAKIGELLGKFSDWIVTSNIVNGVIDRMGRVFKFLFGIVSYGFTNMQPLWEKLKQGAVVVYNTISWLYTKSGIIIGGFFKKSNDDAQKFSINFERVSEVFGKFKEKVAWVFNGLKNVLGPIFESIKKKFDETKISDIGALLTGVGLLKMAKVFGSGIKSVNSIMESFTSVMGQVKETLIVFQKQIKAKAILYVAVAIGILAASIIALSLIKPENLAKGLIGLTVLISELVVAMKLMKATTWTGTAKVAIQMISLGIALMLLASAAKTLSKIEPAALAKGVTAIGFLMASILGFLKLSKGMGSLGKKAKGLVGFAVGIIVLSGAIAILGRMNFKQLAQGTIALGFLMAMIAGFTYVVKKGNLKKSAGNLISFALGIMTLTLALRVLGNLNPKTLAQGMYSLIALMATIAAFTMATKGNSLSKSAGSLRSFAFGILILTAALAVLGTLKTSSLAQGMFAIISLLATIAAFTMVTKGGSLKKSAGNLESFSIGLLILVAAVTILGTLKPANLQQGIGAILSLLAAIAAFMFVVQKFDLKKTVKGLIGFASGFVVFAIALGVLSLLDPGKLAQGVIAISFLMTSIAGFIAITKGGDLKKSAAGMQGFAVGLMILAGVIAVLSALNPAKLMLASVALSVLIGVITAFVKLTGKTNLTKKAVGLILFSAAITIMAGALYYLARLDFKSLLMAGVALSGIILSLALFTNMTKGADLMMTAAGMIIFGFALITIGQALKMVGDLNLLTIVKGLGVLIITLLALALVSKVIGGVGTLALLAISAVLLSFGISCLLVATSISIFVNALVLLSTIGPIGAANLYAIFTMLISLIPLAVQKLGEGMIAFIGVIAQSGVAITMAVVTILTSIVNAIVMMAPVIINGLFVLIRLFVDTLVQNLPYLVQAGFQMLISFLQGIADNIGQIVTVVAEIIINFLDALSAKLPDIIEAGVDLLLSLLKGIAQAIRDKTGEFLAIMVDLVVAIAMAVGKLAKFLLNIGKIIIDGIVAGFTGNTDQVTEAANNLKQEMLGKDGIGGNSLKREFETAGMNASKGLSAGLDFFGGKTKEQAKDTGSGIKDGLKSGLSGIPSLLSGDMNLNPTITPVMDLTNVLKGSNKIDSLLGQNRGINLDVTNTKALGISSGFNSSEEGDAPAGDVVNNFNLTQNNYSPKALSRVEIYRQTKNQFSTLKGAMA